MGPPPPPTADLSDLALTFKQDTDMVSMLTHKPRLSSPTCVSSMAKSHLGSRNTNFCAEVGPRHVAFYGYHGPIKYTPTIFVDVMPVVKILPTFTIAGEHCDWWSFLPFDSVMAATGHAAYCQREIACRATLPATSRGYPSLGGQKHAYESLELHLHSQMRSADFF